MIRSLLLGLFAITQGQLTQEAVPISSKIVSPAVVATWGAHVDRNGGGRLDFLVLWRGHSGWVWTGSFGASTKGPPALIGREGLIESRVVSQDIVVGDVTLQITVNRATDEVTVVNQTISVRKTNVILIDDVDVRGKARIVGTMNVNGQLPGTTRFQAVIQRSKELRAFVRCDVRVRESQEVIKRLLCEDTVGR